MENIKEFTAVITEGRKKIKSNDYSYFKRKIKDKELMGYIVTYDINNNRSINKKEDFIAASVFSDLIKTSII